jgi:hypothetical protein
MIVVMPGAMRRAGSHAIRGRGMCVVHGKLFFYQDMNRRSEQLHKKDKPSYGGKVKPPVALTLQAGGTATWIVLQADRPLPRFSRACADLLRF